jgi:hypothetical protein
MEVAPARQRRLLASLAESGQQAPIVVVAAEDQAGRYIVIGGYKRIAALKQLGRDTGEAVVWPMGEAGAVLLDRSLRFLDMIALAQRSHTSGSWLDLVECLFADVTERCVRRGSHSSVRALEKAMLDYLDQRNRDPKPFVWTAEADPILGKFDDFVNKFLTQDTTVSLSVFLS